MKKETAIKINQSTKDLYCRTIDPSEGFEIEKDGSLTIFNFSSYKSNKHNTSANVSIVENASNTILIKVESIDWISNQQYPYSTQGCFLIQKTVEKFNRVHLSVDRVPCTKKSIFEAVDYLTPAEVKKAEISGRKIKRQGDFFFVEMKKKSNLDALHGSRHEFENGKVKHPEHKMLNLGSGNWKAIQRITMNTKKAD